MRKSHFIVIASIKRLLNNENHVSCKQSMRKITCDTDLDTADQKNRTML